MNETRTLQAVIDPFVKSVDGELVSDLIGNHNPQKNADYFFRRQNVIAELKSLRAGSFVGPFHRKFADLLGDWDRRGLFRAYGIVTIESNKLPSVCREEMFALMAESIQKHVVAEANRQIKSTKLLLNIPDAKGLLWVASDGNEDLQPDVVWYLLTRVLQKRKDSGEAAYTSINGLAYFNPRVPAQISQRIEPALFWFSGTRKPLEDQALQACLDILKSSWWRYVSSANGIAIWDVDGKPGDIRFPGGESKPSYIEINYKQSGMRSRIR